MSESKEPLIVKYRPQSFEEVLGHDEQCRALQRRLDSGNPPHSFLLTGPSGIGKTTLARIIALHIKAEVLEVDAGASGSIETIRELIDNGQHLALSGAAYKMFIIDECHGLSNPAKQALLKVLEEPPDHLFLALCTTEAHRVPETWRTRCYPVSLKPVSAAAIEDLLQLVCEVEGWQPINDVFQAIVQGATGQPRKAITLLERLHDISSGQEARRVMSLLESDEGALFELGQCLVQGKTDWAIIRPILNRIEDDQFDGALIPLGRYLIAAMNRENNAQKAGKIAQMIDAITFPTQTFDPRAQFYSAIKRILWP